MCGLLVWNMWVGTYRGMEIQQVDTVGAQLLQARLDALGDLFGGVEARLAGVLDLCGQGEPPLVPACLTREGLLLATDVDAGGVDLAVTTLLEEVEHVCVLLDGGDSRPGRLVGAKGHQAQDDAGGGV